MPVQDIAQSQQKTDLGDLENMSIILVICWYDQILRNHAQSLIE